jgi:hypothetical protein
MSGAPDLPVALRTGPRMPTPSPAIQPQSRDLGRLSLIQALRQEARLELAIIAGEAGQHSTLLDRCREAWSTWERQAIISILHEDFANAEVILDRGLHALRQVLELVRTDRFSEDEVASLIAAA